MSESFPLEVHARKNGSFGKKYQVVPFHTCFALLRSAPNIFISNCEKHLFGVQEKKPFEEKKQLERFCAHLEFFFKNTAETFLVNDWDFWSHSPKNRSVLGNDVPNIFSTQKKKNWEFVGEVFRHSEKKRVSLEHNTKTSSAHIKKNLRTFSKKFCSKSESSRSKYMIKALFRLEKFTKLFFCTFEISAKKNFSDCGKICFGVREVWYFFSGKTKLERSSAHFECT